MMSLNMMVHLLVKNKIFVIFGMSGMLLTLMLYVLARSFSPLRRKFGKLKFRRDEQFTTGNSHSVYIDINDLIGRPPCTYGNFIVSTDIRQRQPSTAHTEQLCKFEDHSDYEENLEFYNDPLPNTLQMV